MRVSSQDQLLITTPSWAWWMISILISLVQKYMASPYSSFQLKVAVSPQERLSLSISHPPKCHVVKLYFQRSMASNLGIISLHPPWPEGGGPRTLQSEPLPLCSFAGLGLHITRGEGLPTHPLPKKKSNQINVSLSLIAYRK